eukprot:Sspe_Gene.30568::Locus_15111_Transcript_1_1_Confidence_1.000_Length_1668::g.30568::m.30568
MQARSRADDVAALGQQLAAMRAEERAAEVASSETAAAATNARAALAEAEAAAAAAEARRAAAGAEAERAAVAAREAAIHEKAACDALAMSAQDVERARANAAQLRAEVQLSEESRVLHVPLVPTQHAQGPSRLPVASQHRRLLPVMPMPVLQMPNALVATRASELDVARDRQKACHAALVDSQAREAAARASAAQAHGEVQRASHHLASTESRLMHARGNEAAAGCARAVASDHAMAATYRQGSEERRLMALKEREVHHRTDEHCAMTSAAVAEGERRRAEDTYAHVATRRAVHEASPRRYRVAYVPETRVASPLALSPRAMALSPRGVTSPLLSPR